MSDGVGIWISEPEVEPNPDGKTSSVMLCIRFPALRDEYTTRQRTFALASVLARVSMDWARSDWRIENPPAPLAADQMQSEPMDVDEEIGRIQGFPHADSSDDEDEDVE